MLYLVKFCVVCVFFLLQYDDSTPDRPEFDKKARAAEVDHMFALLLAPDGPGTTARAVGTTAGGGASGAVGKKARGKKASSKKDSDGSGAKKAVRVFDGYYKYARGLLQVRVACFVFVRSCEQTPLLGEIWHVYERRVFVVPFRTKG